MSQVHTARLLRRTLPVLAVAGTLVAAIWVGAGAASADHGPHGDGFDVADAAPAPALAGHDEAFWIGMCDLFAASTSSGGIGVAPSEPFTHCIDPGENRRPCPPTTCPPDGIGMGETWEPGGEPAWRLDPYPQAGAHPDMTTMIWLKRSLEFPQVDGDLKTALVHLPPGLVANPSAIPKCTSEHLNTVPNTCPPETQIGVARIVTAEQFGLTSMHPVYNAEARDGITAELAFSGQPVQELGASVPIVASARTDGDFGVDAVVLNIPGGIPLLGQSLTLWGVPWAASHDIYRPVAGYRGHNPGGGDTGDVNGGLPDDGLKGGIDQLQGRVQSQEPQSHDPSWGPIQPFLSNPTECAPTIPAPELVIDSWQLPGDFRGAVEPFDAPFEDCADLPFDPDLAMTPTSSVADSPAGLSVELTLPQNDDPPVALKYDTDDATGAPAYWKSEDGLATAHLRDAVVTLPQGVSLNPSAAAGLEGCTDAQIGLVTQGPPSVFNNEDPFDEQGAECPAGSKVGTAAVYTPLLPGPVGEPNLTGEVVLGVPKSTDPASGEMFRLFIVTRNRQRALLAKIYGSATADPSTGQLTTRFEQNPRVPFENLQLDLKGGQRGLLALPQDCGAPTWSGLLTPWTAAHAGGGLPDPAGGAFAVASRCGESFAPKLFAGMSNRQAGGSGTFGFRFTRADGEQWFASATAKLPTGLVAKLAGVGRCSGAALAAFAADPDSGPGPCPLSSRIGTVDAGGGVGDPFFLERKGDVYLTDGYKGAPLGLAVVVPVEAGPFRGSQALDTIVVRQALHVNPDTAEVTAVSDPFPRIHHGIPLRVREAALRIDRPGFTINPTDCSPKQIVATLFSTEGATASPTVPFHATGCRALGFKPRLSMRLIGRKRTKTGRNPGLRAVLRQGPGQANIERTEIRLPLSLALDPDNAVSDTLCEFEEGRKPDPNCPASSIVGRAVARSPLLDEPLRGPIYFVKNVRIDPTTGNEIRTLPSLLFALRGEIDINVRANSDSRGGKLITTIPTVPDAPVSRFTATFEGGPKGILIVTRTRRSTIDLCRRPKSHVAEVDLDAHSGRRFDQDVQIKVPCKAKGGGKRRR